MHPAYLYPISKFDDGILYNPYIDDFMDSLKSEFIFLNRHKPSDKGIFDIIGYLPQIDYIFFHWPEYIPERRYGRIQYMMFFVLLYAFRVLDIKIVYIVHNKITHTRNRLKMKKSISHALIRNSYRIITHASEGLRFINAKYDRRKASFFFPHPVREEFPRFDEEKETDILIWGNIAPYKGIHRFLKLLRSSPESDQWKILIAGKASSGDYLKELVALKTPNVRIIDEFIDDEKLNSLLSRSKIVLFPYHSDSVLSSGAFAKTLLYPVHIIGSNCGSFSDFSYMKNVAVFEKTSELIPLIREKLQEPVINESEYTEEIIGRYSWRNFGKSFLNDINDGDMRSPKRLWIH